MSTPSWWAELIGVSRVLAATDHAELVDWRGGPDTDEADEDDVPPLTTRLGALGRVFAERVDEFTPQQRQEVLRIVERIQASGGEVDRTAVATGFLEALLNAWDRGFDLRSIWPDMGRESRAYCLAWNRFGGVESPEWMQQTG
ncbi:MULTISPECIES: DUF7674 family protein [Streptomyces]|uniref:Uncharacterized protein n=1 Tax=Streptomyces chengmaiensis TaxID=3040919 RepID=A0ABT6HJD0_9ACTN|nr:MULTISPECIES: hypothetical protein [Streptomyces]MDH2388700.1 hypothetical protein [Streptomyces chengmaiensis]WRQ79130.1 hypothetical protein I3F59_006930 [Streptomyces sp. MUM 178J]